ncbi:hypothetical protein [Variovorax sp. RA8]|uniref:hypothetical protein n=1 Tax=Variovorax sp. (strain JCM 16519 / RA8) TaxID=662548 RepID=UPI001318F5C0|nr:hypothetical protein [Variovorax sp. RA8]VTU34240.1 hypothetical protein RA8CHR_04934 [Variovorax sp. RA8]
MTYRPTLAANDADLIHCSTRTFLSTNTTGDGKTAQVKLRVSRLELRWLDGDVVARFNAQETDVSPMRRVRPSRTER